MVTVIGDNLNASGSFLCRFDTDITTGEWQAGTTNQVVCQTPLHASGIVTLSLSQDLGSSWIDQGETVTFRFYANCPANFCGIGW